MNTQNPIIEEALINHLMDSMLELGDDFALASRQRRCYA